MKGITASSLSEQCEISHQPADYYILTITLSGYITPLISFSHHCHLNHHVTVTYCVP